MFMTAMTPVHRSSAPRDGYGHGRVRYTSGMNLAVLSRHRRLLVLCACSAATHVALLELLATHLPEPASGTPAPSDAGLSVRLAPATTAAPAPAPAPTPAATTSHVHRAAPRKPPRPTAPPATSYMPGTTAAQVAAATPPASPATGATTGAPPEAGPPLLQMPGRYRVRLPAPVQLGYDVVRQDAGGAPSPAGAAHLDWRTDGDRYVLDMDGILGRLHSEGASGDAGVAPRRAREDTDTGPLVTEFDADGHRVVFRATGAESPDNVGIQDRASLLMQLAGIGLAEPDQVRDTIDIVVAGARDLRIAHFRVLGQEDVATGVGTFAAWHLAEVAAPGVARLDVWLAPAQGWLPVRLRTEDAGGSVTQTLSTLGAAPALP